jgi:DeoR/GlpR family transcriptional regulator of sugar metabolism
MQITNELNNGLSIQEISEQLGVSENTVKRDMDYMRKNPDWMYH